MSELDDGEIEALIQWMEPTDTGGDPDQFFEEFFEPLERCCELMGDRVEESLDPLAVAIGKQLEPSVRKMHQISQTAALMDGTPTTRIPRHVQLDVNIEDDMPDDYGFE